MARKIIVLGVSGLPENQQIKKSVALLLVRRLLADWVELNRVIRRRAIREVNILELARLPLEPKEYIPEILPPVEVPNCYFVPPKPLPWQLPAGVPAA